MSQIEESKFTSTKSKKSKFKYVTNYKGLMEVPVVVKPPPHTNDFVKKIMDLDSNPHRKPRTSESGKRLNTSANEIKTNKIKEIPLKPFTITKASYNEKPIVYSELYKGIFKKKYIYML